MLPGKKKKKGRQVSSILLGDDTRGELEGASLSVENKAITWIVHGHLESLRRMVGGFD